MTTEEAHTILDGLIDHLASVEHERWAHWQRYLHSKGIRQADGSLVLPGELVARWEHQMATGYLQLTDEEKESDRDQVRRYLPIIADAFSKG